MEKPHIWRHCVDPNCKGCERVQETLDLVLAPPIVAFFRYIWNIVLEPLYTPHMFIIGVVSGLFVGLTAYAAFRVLFSLPEVAAVPLGAVAGIFTFCVKWIVVSVNLHLEHKKKVGEALELLRRSGLCFYYGDDGGWINHIHFSGDLPAAGSKKYVHARFIPAMRESWVWFLFSRKHLLNSEPNSEVIIVDLSSACHEVTLFVRRLSVSTFDDALTFTLGNTGDCMESRDVNIHALPAYVKTYALIRESGGMSQLSNCVTSSHEVTAVKEKLAVTQRELETVKGELKQSEDGIVRLNLEITKLRELIYSVTHARWIITFAVAVSVFMRSEGTKVRSPHASTSRRVLAGIFSNPAIAYDFFEKWVNAGPLAEMLRELNDKAYHGSHAKILDGVVDRLLAKFGINTQGEAIAEPIATPIEVVTPTPVAEGGTVDPH